MSLPTEKFPTLSPGAESALEMDNLVFMGTNVISGTATVVVLATGNETYFGTMVDEIPFDFERWRMSVVVSEREEHHELICKGAAEEMFDICTQVQYDGHTSPLDASRRQRLLEVLRGLN